MRILKTTLEIILDILTHPIAKLSNFIIRTPPEKWSYGKEGNVILVQGFGVTWSYLIKIGNFINGLGYRVHVLKKLGNNTAKIKKCSEILENYINENAIKDSLIISHSKGGVITKYFLINSKYSNRVSKVISISSPYKGTYSGYVNIFNLGEIVPSSKLIKNLDRKVRVNKMFTNLYPRLDEVVIPNSSLVLKGAKNVKIDVAGHLNIINSPETFEIIKEILTTSH